VLQRAGQTEAAVDLARLAGLYPAGVICEIMNEDGTMARVRELEPFCRAHGIKLITIRDLIQYRMRHERLVRKIAEAALPTSYGGFRIHAFESLIDGEHHVAMVLGEISPRRTCWCGCTRSASPATSFPPPAATVEGSCIGPWR